MADHKVKIGEIARTVIYKDAQGDLIFGFDVEPRDESTEGQKGTLVLEWASAYPKRIDAIKDKTLRIAEGKRLKLAFERTKQYMISCGYLC